MNGNQGRIILDGRPLSDQNTDSPLIGRTAEAAQLQACLSPMFHHEAPLNAWVQGPPGSGRTMLARQVLEQTCANTAARIGVYVNCWQRRSLYSVLQAIIDDLKLLGAEAQDTQFKLDRIRQAFRGRPAVIVLDEIDRPLPVEREAILYGLLGLPKTGLIGIATNPRALPALDERVRSHLSPALIELSPYSPQELVAILTDRAIRALAPGSWMPQQLQSIAHAVDGDARLAIQALRHTAAAAQAAGQVRLDTRLIGRHLRKWQTVHHQARLADLSEHERIIHQLAVRHAPLGATELARRYVEYCRRHDIQPMARRTFSKYLSRLAAAGLLEVSRHAMGSGGRRVRPASVATT